ncbi:TonB-dependent siderophore receptor [Aliarcobacter butzleri]|uniref:TonB-dependent receptor n=1 Tax=Aliarcobacter butzleri TaxID=28197 RepID=A0AAP4UXG3_9BACT|nr:TonB-dependent receptor [Aliarcobacter butzleri]MDN5050843.1 TonB-dependent receptor [Aliarcobacter butzleri]MDN5075847.1 TonB-dependent receptor [Aliarcobacter butzleri]MDN5115470.1 TonB-dependent receptor [Aliarcobacter butzleri]MDN5131240.1 TonB-dependent receptor [Aliarcobacter butzleri]NUW25240.1 TonB-dependent receptor [Aliarcobacter butzleri]
MKNDFSKKNLSIKLCAILLTNTALFAQEATILEEITVKESAYSKYQNEAKPELNRTQISKEDTAKSIQTFNKTFIEDAQLQNIEDIIEMSSNTVYTGDNHGRTNEISMRGFSGVPILLDGIRITNKLAHPEVYNIESVEILKGPDSLQYGQSSPGGLVNLVTKKPTKESLAKIELEVNDNPSYSPKIDLGGAINEDKSLYFRLTSVLKYDEGWTNSNTDTNKIFVAPSLSYDINNNNVITFVTEYTNEKTPSSFGTYVNSKGELVASIKNMSSHPDEEFEKTQKIAGFDIDSVYDTWNSNFKYRYIDYEGENENVAFPFMYQEATGNLLRFFAIQNQKNQEHALQYTLNKETDIFGLKNKFSLGADYNKAYSETIMFADMTTFYPMYLANPNYESLTSLKDHPNAIDMSTPKTSVESYGIFLQDHINLTDKLIFSAGIRYDEVKPKDSQKSDATTPQFGFVYHLTPETILFTNYSQSFTPTSRQDKAGNILDPEKGKGYEVGIKQKLFDDRFDLTTALFKIEKENVATLDINGGNTFVYKASGKQESQGFEVDLSGDITSNLSLIASYGYTETKDKEINNNDLVNIPNHTANIFATYKLAALNLPDYYIGGGARYIGSKYANDTNTIELDSALIYNATVGYKKGNWRANLSVQNLTDEEYVDGSLISDTRGTRVYVGTPRTILATIGYKF